MSSIVFNDCIVEATSTAPTYWYGQFTTNFSFKTLTPSGAPIPNKHLYINSIFYSSDANGIIALSKVSYATSSWQFTIENEGLPMQSQTITITPPPYIPSSIGSTPQTYSSQRGSCASGYVSNSIGCVQPTGLPDGSFYSPGPSDDYLSSPVMGQYLCQPRGAGAGGNA